MPNANLHKLFHQTCRYVCYINWT